MMIIGIVIMSNLRVFEKDRTKTWGKNGMQGGRKLTGV